MLGLLVVACGEDGGSGAGDDGGEAGSALEGEDISITVGVGPGGGYDSYARLLAPWLAEELGANVIVSNEPGAGGLVALNNLLGAQPDGTTIMLINGSGIAGSALAEAEGVNFALDELTYLPRVYSGGKVIGAAEPTGITDFAELDAGDRSFGFGASGPGASTYVEPTVLMEILGLPYDIITGFDGSSDIVAAGLAGEVDGIMVDLDTLISNIDNGDYEPLLLVGPPERDDTIPDTPVLGELDLDSDQEVNAAALEALLELGRTLVIHPDTDPAITEELRGAFDRILTDPEFIETAEEQGRPIGYVDAAGVEELVTTILEAPDEFRDLVRLGF